jgi:hypothetical protein
VQIATPVNSRPSRKLWSMHPQNDTAGTVSTAVAGLIGMASEVDWMFWLGLVLLVARLTVELPAAYDAVKKFIKRFKRDR